MQSRLSSTFNYLSSFFKSPDDMNSMVIDFAYTQYDPTNKTHRDYIDGKISHLNQTYTALMKTDAFIGLPLTLYTLFVLPNCGLLTDVALLGGVLYFLSASDQFQNHHKFQAQREKDVRELLLIYRDIVKTKGVGITEDSTVIKLVKAIAPFVESQSLIHWLNNQTYPNKDFSEAFVKILADSPHKIPRIVLKGNAPIPNEQAEVHQPNILNSVMGATGNKWFSLYHNCKAEFTYALYGLKENEEKVPEQPSVLSQLGLK